MKQYLHIPIIITIFYSITITYAAPPNKSPDPNKPIPVIAALVRYDTFTDTIEALGTTQANEAVIISPKVTETITEINFNDGDHVEPGQLLILLDSEEEQAQFQEALVNLEEQQREYRRLDTLVKQKAIPSFQLDAQRSRLKAAEAQIQIVTSRINDRKIVAPFHGILGFRNVSLGALVKPGDVIATLDDLSVIKLDFTVPETFLANLRSEQSIVAQSKVYPNKSFHGKVATIDSRVDTVTRAVTVRAIIPNEEQLLRPGMLLTVELITTHSQSLTVPEAALIPNKEQQFVYLINNNQVEQREVTIGRRQPGKVEILTGLELNQLVIIEGTLRVKPNSPVTIINAATLATGAKP
jgi:membrane fusion protein (multidrug efflux system)